MAQKQSRAWRPYASYKESGVEWYGPIPTHWDVLALKRLARIRYGLGQPPMSAIEGVPLLRATNIKAGRISPEGMMLVDPADVPAGRDAQLTAGEILVVRSGAYTGDAAMVPEQYHGAFAGYDMVVTVRRGHPQYASWQLLAPEFRDLQVGFHQLRAAQPHLNAEQLGGALLLFPLDEQEAISAFLDRETTKLDKLVAKKKRLIELLQEKRAAVVKHAVTNGLDPGTAMADSRMPWLGEIPAHWTARRLKFAAKLESGHTPSRSVPEYWQNCTIPWVSLNDVAYLAENDYIFETSNYVNELGLANSSARLLPAKTVVLSRDATVGRCGILGSPMATSQHFVDWICSDDIDPKYLLFLFRGPMQQEFERLTMGATIRTIGMPDVNDFRVPLPPIAEQRAIVAHIERVRSAIDSLIAKIRQHIEKLREYRTALISAAVTGKIDVRDQA